MAVSMSLPATLTDVVVTIAPIEITATSVVPPPTSMIMDPRGSLIGAVHGGLACTLLDSAMGCAVHTMLPAGVGYTTVELKVSFLRPITLKTGRLLCEGTIIHLGSRIATAEARLLDTSGKLYGHATTTCMILRNLAPEQPKPSVGE